VDVIAVFQVQKMHDAQEVSVSEDRSAKRRKTSPEVAAAKKKPAITKSTWYVYQYCRQTWQDLMLTCSGVINAVTCCALLASSPTM